MASMWTYTILARRGPDGQWVARKDTVVRHAADCLMAVRACAKRLFDFPDRTRWEDTGITLEQSRDIPEWWFARRQNTFQP